MTDTGAATLTKVAITQAGTGQSVTINGTTMDETTYGTNTTRRKILNNNIVKYDATYNITRAGTITLTFTMPANNTIDEGTLANCEAGSKLSMVEVDGKKSYTNNQATCIRNVSTGITNWTISAYPWGGNNQQITPTLAISNITSPTKPDPITVVGKPNYEMSLGEASSSQGFVDGDGYMPTEFSLILSIPASDTGVLGVEPLEDGNITATLKTTFPASWKITSVQTPKAILNNAGIGNTSLAHGGNFEFVKNAANDVTIKFKDVATAVHHYPTETNSGDKLSDYTYAYAIVNMMVKFSDLPTISTEYSLTAQSVVARSPAGQVLQLPMRPKSLTWKLMQRAYGQPTIFSNAFATLPGWKNYWGEHNPIYTGESVDNLYELLYNVVPGSDYATNLNMCYTWNSNQLRATDKFMPGDQLVHQKVAVEYGVVALKNESSGSDSKVCGKVGDELTGKTFFGALSDAEKYASDNGAAVNAVRLHVDKVEANKRDRQLGVQPMRNIFTSTAAENAAISVSATTDQWSVSNIAGTVSSENVNDWDQYLVPGLLRPTLTAIPTSNNPSRTEHITVTPYTYGQEQNGQISVNLPSGLTPKSGSFTMGGVSIPECSESVTNSCYAINSSTAGSNTTTITFNLGTIGSGPTYPSECTASDIANNSTIEVDDGSGGKKLVQCLPEAVDGKDKDGNPQGVKQDSKIIEFDATVDKDVSVPSTLTISATASGAGTQYTSDGFKTATANVNLANPPAEFGYDLTTTPVSPTIYAKGNLTYNLDSRNTTTNAVKDLTMVNVLPHDHNLTYDLASLSLNTNDATNAKLYYTTSTKARDLDTNNPAALNDPDSGITWTECTIASDGSCSNLPAASTNSNNNGGSSTQGSTSGNSVESSSVSTNSLGANNGITAIKVTADSLPTNSNPTVSYNLTNIIAPNNSTITNSISYIDASIMNGVPMTHQRSNSVTYKGELLQLELDKKELTIPELKANTVDETSLFTTATVRTSTINGYNLTISPVTGNNGNSNGNTSENDVNNNTTTSLLGTKAGSNGKKLELPTLAAGQTLNKNTPAWAIKGGNQTNWTGFDQSKPTLDLHTSSTGGPDTKSIETNFAISSGDVVADTYQGTVRYTLTAGM